MSISNCIVPDLRVIKSYHSNKTWIVKWYSIYNIHNLSPRTVKLYVTPHCRLLGEIPKVLWFHPPLACSSATAGSALQLRLRADRLKLLLVTASSSCTAGITSGAQLDTHLLSCNFVCFWFIGLCHYASYLVSIHFLIEKKLPRMCITINLDI